MGSSPFQIRTHHDEYSNPWRIIVVVVVVECCCFLLLIINDEGAGDARVPFVLLKPGLSEVMFKLLL